jgi:hypothetical protein
MIQPRALRGYIEIELINIIVEGDLFVSPGWMLSAIGFLRDKKNGVGVCLWGQHRTPFLKFTCGGLFTTTVFKGEIYPGAKCRHFAVFNFHVQLGNLCNSQISEGLAGFFDGILGSFLPGIWATSHQFNNLVDTVSHVLPPFSVRVTAAQLFWFPFQQWSAADIPSTAPFVKSGQ